jgi:hypothetical protein
MIEAVTAQKTAQDQLSELIEVQGDSVGKRFLALLLERRGLEHTLALIDKIAPLRSAGEVSPDSLIDMASFHYGALDTLDRRLLQSVADPQGAGLSRRSFVGALAVSFAGGAIVGGAGNRKERVEQEAQSTETPLTGLCKADIALQGGAGAAVMVAPPVYVALAGYQERVASVCHVLSRISLSTATSQRALAGIER